jgi:hypothetical protein
MAQQDRKNEIEKPFGPDALSPSYQVEPEEFPPLGGNVMLKILKIVREQ